MITLYNFPLHLCKKAVLSIFLLILGYCSYGQTYDELFNDIQRLKGQPAEQAPYMRAFLEKAKSEKNAEETVNAYRNYMHNTEGRLSLAYADSMVAAAHHSRDSLLISDAYLSKGIFYYGQKNYASALDHYLKAKLYITTSDDLYLRYKIHYNIAQIKYYLGNYEDALPLLQGCIAYFRKENPRAYLNSLHSLALCYNRMGDIGKSSETAQLGITEGKRLSFDIMDTYFHQVEGINQYFRDNYGTAIQLLSETLPAIIQNNDFANEAVGNFYLGKSYLALKETEKAVICFRKVDEIFKTYGYMREDLRASYLFMVDYYKARRNFEAQLYQLNQLQKADSVLKLHFKHLSHTLHKEYDTKEILEEKEKAKRGLEKTARNQIRLYLVIGFLCLLIAFFIVRHHQIQKLYKQRFESLMEKENRKKVPDVPISTADAIPEINPDAVKALLKQLEKFENSQKYLDKDWTLFKLAAHFNANTKYLSQIIHHYRHQNFPEYINGLKMGFILELLKTDRKIRKYTHKALAEEAGFSSTQRFTNAFKSFTGISPSFFIQELEKQESALCSTADG